jgi:hypothetical protein
MTAAWTFAESAWKRHCVAPVTRWAFARVARVYGFVPMPPVPPDPDEVEARDRKVAAQVADAIAVQLSALDGDR